MYNAEGLISAGMFDGYLQLLAFRHAHVYGYGQMLDETRLREIANPAPSLIREFLTRLR